MTARRSWTAETLHVVLDDATVDRLREAAAHRGIEVEQLIVQIIHHASWGSTVASVVHLPDSSFEPECEPGRTSQPKKF